MPATAQNPSNSVQSARQRRGYHHRNRSVTVPDGAMAVGLIVGAHGLNGEVKIELHTDFPERFTAGNSVLMGADLAEVEIETGRPHKAFYLVRFNGVTNRTDAENLRGQWLFIRDEDAVPLGDGVYWIHDIIGMEVQDTDGRLLGTVRNILETGANDVYVVDAAQGINRGREILLPAISDVIQTIDLENRVFVVHLIPGLIDEVE